MQGNLLVDKKPKNVILMVTLGGNYGLQMFSTGKIGIRSSYI